jgi:hypothetical protein
VGVPIVRAGSVGPSGGDLEGKAMVDYAKGHEDEGEAAEDGAGLHLREAEGKIKTSPVTRDQLFRIIEALDGVKLPRGVYMLVSFGPVPLEVSLGDPHYINVRLTFAGPGALTGRGVEVEIGVGIVPTEKGIAKLNETLIRAFKYN